MAADLSMRSWTRLKPRLVSAQVLLPSFCASHFNVVAGKGATRKSRRAGERREPGQDREARHTTRPQGLAQGLDQGLTLAQALVAHFGHQALVESPPRLGGALVVYKKPLGGDFWELDDFWRRLGKGHRLGKDGAR